MSISKDAIFSGVVGAVLVLIPAVFWHYGRYSATEQKLTDLVEQTKDMKSEFTRQGTEIKTEIQSQGKDLREQARNSEKTIDKIRLFLVTKFPKDRDLLVQFLSSASSPKELDKRLSEAKLSPKEALQIVVPPDSGLSPEALDQLLTKAKLSPKQALMLVLKHSQNEKSREMAEALKWYKPPIP